MTAELPPEDLAEGSPEYWRALHRRVFPPCGPDDCLRPLACLSPSCYGTRPRPVPSDPSQWPHTDASKLPPPVHLVHRVGATCPACVPVPRILQLFGGPVGAVTFALYLAACAFLVTVMIGILVAIGRA